MGLVSVILGLLFFGACMFFGIKFALKKLKKQKIHSNNDMVEIEKEFEEGNILMPVDKRDFEDIEEFKKHTSQLPEISEQLEDLDRSLKNIKLSCLIKDGQLVGELKNGK